MICFGLRAPVKQHWMPCCLRSDSGKDWNNDIEPPWKGFTRSPAPSCEVGDCRDSRNPPKHQGPCEAACVFAYTYAMPIYDIRAAQVIIVIVSHYQTYPELLSTFLTGAGSNMHRMDAQGLANCCLSIARLRLNFQHSMTVYCNP